MTARRGNRRVQQRVSCHRAMEGNASRSICGMEYLAEDKPYAIGPVTSYRWEKVSCKKCLSFKHNYDGT